MVKCCVCVCVKHSIVLWLGPSLVVSLYLRLWISQVLLNHLSILRRTEWLDWPGVMYFSSSGQLHSDKILWVTFWLNSFSLGKTLLRRTDCFGVFPNCSFFLPLLAAQKDFFLRYSLLECGWASGLQTYKSVGVPLCTGLPGVFDSQTCPHWPFSNLFITIHVFLPGHWFPLKFLLQEVVILFTCLCLQFGG